ncbi:MAG: lysophospholipid acyltransferase family protein [Alkalilacustris sp.]
MVAVQYLRSVVFIALMYLSMAAMALVFAPVAAVSRDAARVGIRAWARWVRWLAHHVAGLSSEVRGPVPRAEVLVAAKHQSFFDIIILLSVLPNPRFVMKKELERAPILGWYARRIGCVSVDRGRKGQAIRAMVEAVHRDRTPAGQLVIYPQGTRVAPGVVAPYKVGTAVLYQELGAPCVPVACNVGVFWARHSLYRRPGRAVVAFLPEIPPGLEMRAFLTRLEAEVETASNRLTAETAFDGRPQR